jgi:hypothetical protein
VRQENSREHNCHCDIVHLNYTQTKASIRIIRRVTASKGNKIPGEGDKKRRFSNARRQQPRRKLNFRPAAKANVSLAAGEHLIQTQTSQLYLLCVYDVIYHLAGRPVGRSLGRPGSSVCIYVRERLRRDATRQHVRRAARKYLLSRLKQKMQFHTWTERQVLRFIPLCSRRAAAPIELATLPVRISEHIISLCSFSAALIGPRSLHF